MTVADKEEYQELKAAVQEVESLLTGSPDGTSPVLTNFLRNARHQLADLKSKIEIEEREEQDKTHAEMVSAAFLEAQREKALSQSERETFAGFLSEDHFTKRDFDSLEKFYHDSWDRLSEHGKDEMSHRIWEGVRQGEYEFTDLPDDPKEKESERIRQQLAHSQLTQIPEQDRADFIKAYDSGNKAEAYKILDRDSFKKNVATETPAAEPESINQQRGTESAALAAHESNQTTTSSAKDSDTSAAGQINLDGINLQNISLCNSADAVTTPNLPRANTPVGKTR